MAAFIKKGFYRSFLKNCKRKRPGSTLSLLVNGINCVGELYFDLIVLMLRYSKGVLTFYLEGGRGGKQENAKQETAKAEKQY